MRMHHSLDLYPDMRHYKSLYLFTFHYFPNNPHSSSLDSRPIAVSLINLITYIQFPPVNGERSSVHLSSRCSRLPSALWSQRDIGCK